MVDSDAHPFEQWIEQSSQHDRGGVSGYIRNTLLEMRASIHMARGESGVFSPEG